MRLILALLAVSAVLPADDAAAQCGTSGTFGMPQIAYSSDLLDSNSTFTLSGALPGAGWILLADATPGPTPTGYGTLCLGPTAFVLINALGGGFPIGPNGSISFTATLPPSLAGAIGFTLYMHAAVLDPGAATGFAFTNGLAFTLRAPRVFVVSDGVAQRSVDIVDSIGFANASGPWLLDTIGGEGHSDLAVARDGGQAFLRNLTFSTNDSVRAYDVSKAPATFLGEAIYSTTGVGTSRQGVVLTADDSTGYFVDTGGLVHRFDADPASPAFMTLTGMATITVPGPDSLVISNDDSRLYVVGGTGSGIPSVMCVVDTKTMTEVATISLTDNTLFLGIAVRSAIDFSPDGRYVATIQEGVYSGVPGFNGAAAVNVVDADPASPTFHTEIAYVPLPNYGQIQVCFAPNVPGYSRLYTLESDAAGNLFLAAIDWTTGQIASVAAGTGGTGAEEGGVATTPNGNYVFVGSGGDDTLRVFTPGFLLLNSAPMPTSGVPGRIRVERR